MLSKDPLKAIRQCYEQLRRSEKKVADLVISQPTDCINLNIGQLSRQADVSEPTVMRFCKAIGCSGFQDFKLQLAQNLGSGTETRFASLKLNKNDSIESITNKVFDSTIKELSHVRNLLNMDNFQTAINALTQARRVEFFGFGASGAVARDARHKFIRLQAYTTACADPHIQLISASTMTDEDVIVAISQTGRTKDLLHSIKLARKNNARVIGICPDNTPLADNCDFPLAIAAEEDTNVFTPLTSRIVHLVVIDVLATGVALQKEPDLSVHLQNIKNGLRSLRIDT